MRVLVVGASGMLGQAVVDELGTAGYDVIGLSRHSEIATDITDGDALLAALAEAKADVIVNTAAEVNLTGCERDPGRAYLLNTRAESLITEFCRDNNLYHIFISTDHYYAGDGRALHTETAPIVLLNEYSRTKYLGECAALAYDRSLVLRTNIVGFRGDVSRPTFAEWAIGAIEGGEALTLFTDFFTSSVDVRFVSRVIHQAIETELTGLYNVAAREAASKEEFICELARGLDRDITYTPGSVKNITGARRADSLGLDCTKIEQKLGIAMPSLNEVIASLVAEYREIQKKED